MIFHFLSAKDKHRYRFLYHPGNKHTQQGSNCNKAYFLSSAGTATWKSQLLSIKGRVTVSNTEEQNSSVSDKLLQSTFFSVSIHTLAAQQCFLTVSSEEARLLLWAMFFSFSCHVHQYPCRNILAARYSSQVPCIKASHWKVIYLTENAFNKANSKQV